MIKSFDGELSGPVMHANYYYATYLPASLLLGETDVMPDKRQGDVSKWQQFQRFKQTMLQEYQYYWLLRFVLVTS